MEEKKLRVALFGRFCSRGEESIQTQKEKLREEAKKRGYVIVDEFWEDDFPADVSLDDRPEIKRFFQSVWTEELKIDGLFLTDLESLAIGSRKEHVTFMVFFEQNNLSIITREETYNPDDWMVGLSF